MTGIVRLFGWLSVIAGAIIGAIAVFAPSNPNPLSIVIGVAYFLGGLFGLAICTTIADSSDRTAAIVKHLELDVKGDDSFRLRG